MAYIINQDNYYQRTQPAKSEELINIVEVNANPLTIQDYDDEFYKSSEPIAIAAGETITTEIKYKSIPVLDPCARAYWVAETTTEPPWEELEYYDEGDGEIANVQLATTIKYYAWGAVVTISNDRGIDGYAIVVVSGWPLKVDSPSLMTAQDEDSIAENGILKYRYPDNHLIQTRGVAQDIADTLLAGYVIPRKDINIQWRGNPALTLLDEAQIPEYQKDGINTQGIFSIFKNCLEFDGTLKGNLDGRKVSVPATTTTTEAPTTTTEIPA